ncbi:MAG: hypothetical protein GF307_10015 [candidate division Zixibacteria bacterium]|nr:hypothetical protein [candidate division Zixibacteria bacterium]
MSSKEIIEKYFKCWIENDREGARSFMADNLKFRSPRDSFDNADEFMDECWSFAKDFNEMNIQHEIYDSNGGYIVYNAGDKCFGELYKMRDGRITEIYVTFDPTR